MRQATRLPCILCCIPAFSDTLILNDGSSHEGTLVSATSRWITFQENGASRRYARSSVQTIELGDAANANNNYNQNGSYDRDHDRDRQNGTYNNGQTTNNSGERWGHRNSNVNLPNNATLPAGTQVSVTTDENIDSSSASEGQTFPASVSSDVTDSNGNVLIPRGSQAQLVLRQVSQAGATGTSEIALDLDSVMINGQRYVVSTQDITQAGKEGIGKNRRTATMVGGGAVLGTLIGAIAGGGKGAAIGAVTGGAAGAGAQVLTRGKDVKVPAETKLNFQLDQDLHLQATR